MTTANSNRSPLIITLLVLFILAIFLFVLALINLIQNPSTSPTITPPLVLATITPIPSLTPTNTSTITLTPRPTWTLRPSATVTDTPPPTPTLPQPQIRT